MLKDKQPLYIVIASLLGALLIVLLSYICYHFTASRKKLKEQQLATYTGSREVLEYNSLRFTYDTNIETQQTNYPADLAYENLHCNIPGEGSFSSESSFDRFERQDDLRSIDLIQPLTSSSKSSSRCSGDGLIDVVLVNKKSGNAFGRSPVLRDCGLGRLSAALFFDNTLERLRVNVIQWENVGSKSLKSTLSPYVKVQLLPDLERKYFTKTKRIENPVFDEEFIFSVAESELKDRSLQLSVCDFDKFSRQHILGYGVINLDEYIDKLSLSEGTGELWMNLSESDKISSQEKGELSFSLSYFPTSGRINVTVVKAKDLNMEDNETRIAVKASLLFAGKVIKSRKTSYHQSDLVNPIFNESWVFDIPSDVLELTSFHLCVYAYSPTKKRVIGTATTGSQVQSKSGLAQWNEMLLQRRDPVLHWHKLV